MQGFWLCAMLHPHGQRWINDLSASPVCLHAVHAAGTCTFWQHAIIHARLRLRLFIADVAKFRVPF